MPLDPVSLSAAQKAQRTATTAQLAVGSAYSLATRGRPVKTRPVAKVLGFLGKAGHGWTGSTGVDLNDTTIPMLGDRSATATLAANDSKQINSPNLTAFSVVGKTVRVVYRYTGNITGVILYMSSDSGLNNRTSRNILNLVSDPAGTDLVAEFDVADLMSGTGSVTGTPDLANITNLRVLPQSGPAGGTVSLAAVYLIDKPASLPNGAVVMSFDDSRLDGQAYARPKLAEKGYAATLYPNCATVGSDAANYYDLTQLQYMQDVHGFEVASHCIDTAHHVDHVGQTEAWLRDHFEQIVAWNKARGFRGDSYAWPNTNSDALARRVAADYFRSSRGGRSDSNEVFPPTRPMDFRAINGGSYTLAQLKAFVDRAKQAASPSGRSVAHFFFHTLPVTKVAANDVARQDFYDLVDYIAAQGVPVFTQSQLMELSAA